MKVCAVITCGKREGVLFHRFPANECTRAKWVLASGNPKLVKTLYLEDNMHHYICGLHFKKDDYKSGKKIKLIEGTLPTLLLPKQLNEDVIRKTHINLEDRQQINEVVEPAIDEEIEILPKKTKKSKAKKKKYPCNRIDADISSSAVTTISPNVIEFPEITYNSFFLNFDNNVEDVRVMPSNFDEAQIDLGTSEIKSDHYINRLLNTNDQLNPIDLQINDRKHVSSLEENNEEQECYDVDKICRTCLTEKEDMTSLFSYDENTGKLVHNLVTSVTSFQISENDGLPRQICNDCLEEIRRALSFKEKCENSIKKLYDSLSLKNADPLKLNEITVECIPDNGKKYLLSDDQFVEYVLVDDDVTEMEVSNVLNTRHNLIEKHSKKKRFSKKKIKVPLKLPEKMHKCDLCSTYFLLKKNLFKHRKTHFDGGQVQEGADSEEEMVSFIEQTSRDLHSSQDKENEGVVTEEKLRQNFAPYSCDICNRPFAYKTYLRDHIGTHFNYISLPNMIWMDNNNESLKIQHNVLEET